jgi:hypothetical protein
MVARIQTILGKSCDDDFISEKRNDATPEKLS